MTDMPDTLTLGILVGGHSVPDLLDIRSLVPFAVLAESARIVMHRGDYSAVLPEWPDRVGYPIALPLISGHNAP